MKVLIAGYGYTGAALGQLLVSQGHSVFGMRRSASGCPGPGQETVQHRIADISQPRSLAQVAPQFDWVVNSVSSGKGGLEQYQKIYLEGTRNLLKWLEPAALAKYVHLSSTSVYGQTDQSEVTEETATAPSSDLARTLLQSEQELLTAFHERKFPVVILRVAGIYGPGRTYFLQQFLSGAQDPREDRHLNMIHRDDLIGIISRALSAGAPGEIYNVVDNLPVSSRRLSEWLAQVLNRGVAPKGSQDFGSRKRAYTDKKVSNRKLKEELGYEFLFSTFEEGYLAELKRLGVL